MITVIRAAGTQPSDPAEGTFDGVVWRNMIERAGGVGVGDVFFTPGSRTHWHTHAGGQLLIIRSGVGLVGGEDGVRTVQAGDLVWTPGGVPHWHGATEEQCMLHTAVSIGDVTWHASAADSATEAHVPRLG